MHFKVWTFLCFILLFYGCASIKPEKINFNTAKKLYEYGYGDDAITLRDNNNQLVDSTNFENFKIELLEQGLHYPFSKRRENEDLLRASDFKLAQVYAGINSAIQNNECLKALEGIALMRHIYPAIDYHSDSYFLEGYAYEKMGLLDSATVAYRQFYTYSGQKYSKLFRGHRNTDRNDEMYITEREYANLYLNQKPDSLNEKIIHPITPKYYYTSYQPGFVLNPEDFGKNTKYLSSFFLGWSPSNDLALGYQLSYLMNENVNINTIAYCSKNAYGFGLHVPIQLYKSESNKFGVKLSPFVSLDIIDSLKVDGDYQPIGISLINWGARISAAYFLNQKLWVGAYYQYNFYNENHKYLTSKYRTQIWYKNEFDVSVYYPILKNLSLKAGVKNLDFVAGLYLGGLELSYNITSQKIILKTDLF